MVRIIPCRYPAHSTLLCARFRRKQYSVVAIAHTMLRTRYAMLSQGQHDQDTSVGYEAINVARNAPRWIRMLKKHGFIAEHAHA